MNPPTIEEVSLQCSKIGLPEREADKFMAYYESCGWVIGRSKKPVVSWRGCLRTWKLNLDEKQEINGRCSASVECIRNQKALERAEEKLKWFKGQMPLTSDKLKQEFNELKIERTRLMKLLNFKA